MLVARVKTVFKDTIHPAVCVRARGVWDARHLRGYVVRANPRRGEVDASIRETAQLLVSGRKPQGCEVHKHDRTCAPDYRRHFFKRWTGVRVQSLAL